MIRVVIILALVLGIFVSSWGKINDCPVIMQENYAWRLTDSFEIADGIRIWYPVEGDQSTYDVFPCAPYVNMIEKLEIRGDNIAD